MLLSLIISFSNQIMIKSSKQREWSFNEDTQVYLGDVRVECICKAMTKV